MVARMEHPHAERRDPLAAPRRTDPPPSDPRVLLVPPPQAARAISVSERTLYTLTKRGLIPAVRIGRAVRYDPADLRAFVDRAKAACPQDGGAR
jgi:excisionase family DNA binding protein